MNIRSTPWQPRRLEQSERFAKTQITNRFPARSTGLYLGALSELLGCDNLVLKLSDIRRGPERQPGEVVLIALSNTVGAPSWRGVLALPGALARLILDTGLSRPTSAAGLPLTSGEQGALLYLVDRAVKDWSVAGGGRFYISGLLADTDQIPAYLGRTARWRITTELTGDGVQSRLHLYLTDPIPRSSPVAPTPGVAHLAGRWPVRIGISVGCARVPLAEIGELGVGDVILLDEGCHPKFEMGSAPVVLGCGRWSRPGAWLDPRRIRLLSVNEKGAPMETESSDKPDILATLETTQDEDAADMEVMVRVEIGQVRLTVDQATRLAPGRVIELDREVGSEVALKVGDKLIGRGELVDHEGRLAVEVLEVK